jgi:hypothetical protein
LGPIGRISKLSCSQWKRLGLKRSFWPQTTQARTASETAACASQASTAMPVTTLPSTWTPQRTCSCSHSASDILRPLPVACSLPHLPHLATQRASPLSQTESGPSRNHKKHLNLGFPTICVSNRGARMLGDAPTAAEILFASGGIHRGCLRKMELTRMATCGARLPSSPYACWRSMCAQPALQIVRTREDLHSLRA